MGAVIPLDRACRVCGCTDAKACPGGCSWVAADLCSECCPETKARRSAVRRAVCTAIEETGYALAELAPVAVNPALVEDLGATHDMFADETGPLTSALLSLAGAIDALVELSADEALQARLGGSIYARVAADDDAGAAP